MDTWLHQRLPESQLLRLDIDLAMILCGLTRDLTSQIEPINDRTFPIRIPETYPKHATSKESRHSNPTVRPHHIRILRDRRESDANRSTDRNRHPENTRDHRAKVLGGIVESDLDAGHQDPDFAERSENVSRSLDPDIDTRGWRGVDEVLEYAGVDHAERGAEKAEGDAADWVEVDAGFT